MNYLVVGLGVSGRAAVRFLLHKGHSVFGTDKNLGALTHDPAMMELTKRGLVLTQSPDLSHFDQIVVSPGVPHTDKVFSSTIPIIGELELGLQGLLKPVLAITGTNGKTTVTEMTAHVLRECGKSAFAVGNNGVALCDWRVENESKDCVVVVEMSSYQIETMQTKTVDAGVILNLTPDHLDRYGTLENYLKAKVGLYNLLKVGGELFVHPDLLSKLKVPARSYYDFIQEFGLHGKLNYQQENQLASFALVRHLGITPEQFLQAVSTFKRPPHRLEYVREVAGVTYINDSKGTNVDSVLKAVEATESGVILIAGGRDKGSPYAPWVKGFAGKVKAICLLGEAAELMEETLSHAYPCHRCNSLQEAVDKASKLAEVGDTVLLSPGCASFDMFKDYQERGNLFKQHVATLKS